MDGLNALLENYHMDFTEDGKGVSINDTFNHFEFNPTGHLNRTSDEIHKVMPALPVPDEQ
jgi:hypothetical protein